MNKISQVFGSMIYLEIFYLGKYILLQVLICSDNMGTQFWNCFSQKVLLLSWYLLFSHSVVSDSLQSHGLQYARLPYPSPHPRVCSNLCPLHGVSDAIQTSHPPSYPSPPAFNLSLHQSFQSWLFASGGQNIGASASSLPMNTQGWFPLGFDLVWSPCSPKDSQRSSPKQKVRESINPSALSLLYGPISHPYMTTGKTIALTRQTFVGNVSAF